MASDETQRLADVCGKSRFGPSSRSSHWRPAILQSLEQTIGKESSSARSQALLDLIGMLKTDRPPVDVEMDRILEEERLKKYG